jgi:hypothetical protein
MLQVISKRVKAQNNAIGTISRLFGKKAEFFKSNIVEKVT